jgi:hypothetical protein
MLVIDVGVKFRTVRVKCANIFDQDCSSFDISVFYDTAGTKRRLQVGILQVGNFAGWNFAGWNFAGWNFAGWEFCMLGILQVGILQVVRNFAV